jgi:hypothetical protein
VNAPETAAALPVLTVVDALDFLHRELGQDGPAMLTYVQRELARRTLAALAQDETAAAKQLGLSKAALKKLLE